jgi:DNA (cytosine-5)-methyltransferase 1
MKVLNLYTGIGGNRKLWTDVEVTAVENNPQIAQIYQDFFPNDRVIVADAHQYLLEHFKEFDFIWSSPPCPSHSNVRYVVASSNNPQQNQPPVYPDMKLYEEILFLKHNFKGLWVVENVKPYYDALLDPTEVGRHLFWSNFNIDCKDKVMPKNFINLTTVAGSKLLKEWLGIHYEGNVYYDNNHCPAQVLRNCVHPEVGQQVLLNALKS